MGLPPGAQPPPPDSGRATVPPPTPRKPSKTCLAVALALGGIVVLAGTAVMALLGTVEAQTGTTPTGPRTT
ncbi:hypothetical protein [Streptomyces exfoliatus]|uniref:hypothetical protein n=1 Tax=Streptomyces exfoliatus TaxID=1905 RepID=UPI0012FF1D11|nr:hypothetical protein [Streptomyces exfoliatus]